MDGIRRITEMAEADNKMAEVNREYVELKTRVQVVEDYIKISNYPSLEIICAILCIKYPGEGK